MLCVLRRLTLIVAVIYANQSFAEEVISDQLVVRNEFSENRYDISLIRGGNVLGVASPGVLDTTKVWLSNDQTARLRVGLGVPNEMLCFRLKSRDGAYEGRIDYKSNDATAGWHLIEFETTQSSYLSRLASDELVVSAYHGSNCTDTYPDQTIYAPIAVLGESIDTFYVLVNTRDNDAQIISIADDGSETTEDCLRLDGAMIPTKVQRKCPVPHSTERVIIEADDGFGGLLWREEVAIARPDGGDK